MSTTLSTWCSPSIWSCSPGCSLAWCSRCLSARQQRVDDQRRLARPRDAGHAGEDADGEAHRQVAQVVRARAFDRDVLVARLAAGLRRIDALAPRQIGAGQRRRRALDVFGRARGDDAPAVDAGARAHVDHVIGRHDRLFVVLDDEHGVAEIAQLLQRVEQARVVTLMQPDRRLVEDVEHAHERRADLRRQPDALRLAARQRRRGAVERQVLQPDVDEEVQPLGDLAQDALGDLPSRDWSASAWRRTGARRESASW